MQLTTRNKKNLTPKQELFLENLIATKGDIHEAAELAGYAGNPYQVIKSLKEEIIELAHNILAKEAPKAAFKLVEIMTGNKPIANVNTKLQAAQTLLDRVGVVKQEKLDINHNVQGGIFILPEKEIIDVEAEEVNVEEERP
tara:strand:- start:384 stop:806 length:423 start_codon:yes stop_codon:yes gene_type:complete